MATTVAKGRPVELTSHTPTLMDVDMDPSAQSADPEEDLYTRLKTLQRQLEFYEIQVPEVEAYDLSSAYRTNLQWSVCPCHNPGSINGLNLGLAAGGVHQRRTAKLEAGAVACSRGGQANSGSASGHRPVLGDD